MSHKQDKESRLLLISGLIQTSPSQNIICPFISLLVWSLQGKPSTAVLKMAMRELLKLELSPSFAGRKFN